jgi:MFS family permease
MIFILTNYLQGVLAYSALLTGIAFVPMGIVFLAVSAFLSARFVNSFGVKPILILGMTLQTVGYLILSVFPLADYFGGLLLPMVILGFGTGLGFTAINIGALTGTRRGEEGLASGLINTSRQIGGPIGLAVILTVANLQNPSLTHNLLPSAATFGTGLDYAFLAAAVFTGFGIIIANLLKQERHHLARVVQATDS